MGRVLIIEANPGAMIVARNVLARDGHQVTTAADVADGLVKATEVELLLLDGGLADEEVLAALGRKEAPLPIILTVPHGLGPSLLQALPIDRAAGIVVTEVLEKPFVADGLVRAVNDALTPDEVTLDAELACEVIHITDASDIASPLTPFAQLTELFGTGNSEVEILDGDLVMAGRLGHVSVAHVLQFAESMTTTVCCSLERAGRTVRIYLRERGVFWACDSESEPTQLELGRQTQALVFDVLDWSWGRFRISVQPAIPEEGELAGVQLPLAPLLLEGMRRLDEAGHLRR